VFRMRQSVKSKGAFYNGMADEVAALEDAGGPAVGRAARFLSEASILVFRRKLTRKQHVMFEMAWAMAELESAVALCKAAAGSGDRLLKSQSRVWAAQVALEVPSRMLSVFSASDAFDQASLAELTERADLPGAIALQSGTLQDMDFIARSVTAD